MNKTTKVILMSVLTIVACVTLISGATFALFTSESNVNIAVSSGKVDVAVTAQLTGAYSAAWDETSGYIQEAKSIDEGIYKFTTGGTAAYVNGKLTLENIVPGDGVTMQLQIENRSTVATQYRIVMTAEDSALMKELKVTLNAAEGSSLPKIEDGGGAKFTLWTPLDAAEGDGEMLGTLDLTVELPIDATNAAQGDSAEINIKVEAVQGNAATTNLLTTATTNYVTSTIDFVALKQQTDAMGKYECQGMGISLTEDVDLSSASLIAAYAALGNGGVASPALYASATDTIGAKGPASNQVEFQFEHIFSGVFNGNGHTISNFYVSGAFGGAHGGLFSQLGYNTSLSGVPLSWNGEVVIENVTFKDATAEVDSSTGSGSGARAVVGLIAGCSYGIVTFRNVNVQNCIVRDVTDYQVKHDNLNGGYKDNPINVDHIGVLVGAVGHSSEARDLGIYEKEGVIIENVHISLDMARDEFFRSLSDVRQYVDSDTTGSYNIYVATKSGTTVGSPARELVHFTDLGGNSITFNKN